MKRQIKVGFVDFWDGFVPETSVFGQLLSLKYDLIFSDNPDYLFYSVFGQEHLEYDCVRIFYTGENQSPDFNICDYAIGFDHLTFGDRYFRYPIYYNYTDDFNLMTRKHLDADAARLGKSAFCSFVASNNKSSPERELFLDKLSSYKQVSSGGRFRNNVGGPVEDKLKFQMKHKFAMAFENCSQPGYCTEKLVQAFAAGAVPIYWGDPGVCECFNGKAFINCGTASSFDEVVERVKAVDNDDEAYLNMLKEPALTPGAPGLEEMRRDLAEFLYHIIDQPLENATRANRHYWGKRYLHLMRIREKAYSISPRGVAELIYKKTLWKWRRKSGLLWKIDRLFK